MKTLIAICASIFVLSGNASASSAMPKYESTGTIELTLNGKKTTFHSTSNTVPGQADRLIHTANWRTFKPMMLGGVNLAPPGILISITARPTVEPDLSAPRLSISFSVDENDYSLIDANRPEVKLTIKEGKHAGDYQHESATITVSSVTPQGDALEVRGKAAGVLSGPNTEQGSSRTLDYEAEFHVLAHPN